MLRPRIIVSLLVSNELLYKTVQFSSPKYVGDPINAVKIFNEKNVDELLLSDFTATIENREPNYRLISEIASQCRMPLAYSGGVKSPEEVERIIQLGVEKVAVGTAAINNINLIYESAKRVGSQSIAAVLDVMESNVRGKYDLCSHSGSRKLEIDFVRHIQRLEEAGSGEIIVNSISRDGTMLGYDFDLIDLVRSCCSIPITILGGASSLENIAEAVSRFSTIGLAAGSLYVFKGKFRAVLISYPDQIAKQKIIQGI